MNLDAEIVKIIGESKTIAVVGASRNPERAAYIVPSYLQAKGYKIIPINPKAEEIHGEKALKSLSEIKEPIDIVDVFRPSDEAVAIVKEAIKLNPKLIWLQLGIKSEKARQLAEEHGIKFVMDSCLKVEHTRLFGSR